MHREGQGEKKRVGGNLEKRDQLVGAGTVYRRLRLQYTVYSLMLVCGYISEIYVTLL